MGPGSWSPLSSPDVVDLSSSQEADLSVNPTPVPAVVVTPSVAPPSRQRPCRDALARLGRLAPRCRPRFCRQGAVPLVPQDASLIEDPVACLPDPVPHAEGGGGGSPPFRRPSSGVSPQRGEPSKLVEQHPPVVGVGGAPSGSKERIPVSPQRGEPSKLVEQHPPVVGVGGAPSGSKERLPSKRLATSHAEGASAHHEPRQRLVLADRSRVERQTDSRPSRSRPVNGSARSHGSQSGQWRHGAGASGSRFDSGRSRRDWERREEKGTNWTRGQSGRWARWSGPYAGTQRRRSRSHSPGPVYELYQRVGTLARIVKHLRRSIEDSSRYTRRATLLFEGSSLEGAMSIESAISTIGRITGISLPLGCITDAHFYKGGRLVLILLGLIH